MGGARLRSKYQTKEVYRTTTEGAISTAPVPKPATVKTKVRKSSSKDSEEKTLKSKLMARRLQGGSAMGKRRDIQGVVKAAEKRMEHKMRNH